MSTKAPENVEKYTLLFHPSDRLNPRCHPRGRIFRRPCSPPLGPPCRMEQRNP